MKKISILAFCLTAMLWSSCREEGGHAHGSGSHAEDAHGHPHGPAGTAISQTIWTGKSELFVEFKPLVVGEISRFAAHFTDMRDYSPVTEGALTVSLIQGNKGIRHTVDVPSSPGIFTPSLQPKNTGIYSLVFELKAPGMQDKITIPNVEVFASMADAESRLPAEQESPNEISFLKEQAWKMEFANAPVVRDTVYDIIRTGGQVLPAQGDEKTITATANGIVMYRSTDITVGTPVGAGKTLFTIAGGNITGNNVETQYRNAKSNYDQAKAAYERIKELYDSEAIAKSEYEEALLAYQIAETEYLNLSANFSKGGKSIRSKNSGFITRLFKQEGEYVAVGEPLAIIAQNKKLTIQAEVNQADFPKLNNDITANFLLDGKVYPIEAFNGKLLSFGKTVSEEQPKIPVYFELDNAGTLLPGSFIEVWIKTQPAQNALVIPVEALLEEYGAYSVIVQTGGESFEKREVRTGASDGQFVAVLSGVKEGERVVTTGAYQVKMASMSGQVPAHGHSH